MKRGIFLFIFVIIIIRFVSSGSVGITPAYYKEFFEPNDEKKFTFSIFNSNTEGELKTYVRGDLAQYIHIDKEFVKNNEKFEASLKFPAVIEKPGEHSIYIGVTEVKDLSEGVGGVAAIESKVTIFVPFPGIYLESTFDVKNINQGELVPYEIVLNNLGTEETVVKPEIKVLDQSQTNQTIISVKLDDVPLKSKESKKINGILDTRMLSSGSYRTILTLGYERKKDKIEKEFKIGKFSVDILDYSYLFKRGKINPFKIEVESKWNTKINRVYAEVIITDSGRIVEQFKTPFLEIEPWEKKNLTGYLDATDLESKRYLANIILYFDDGTTTKLVAIYVQDPPTKETTFYIMIGVSLLVALIAITLLIIKNKRLFRNQNEKNK